MKPITDDVVFSIMKGLEKRERTQRSRLEAAKVSLPDRVLGSISNKRIISLDTARRTVSGVFCYVARD